MLFIVNKSLLELLLYREIIVGFWKVVKISKYKPIHTYKYGYFNWQKLYDKSELIGLFAIKMIFNYLTFDFCKNFKKKYLYDFPKY